MRVLKVAQDRHIVLPKRLFRPDDTVLIVTEGDTVVIKFGLMKSPWHLSRGSVQ